MKRNFFKEHSKEIFSIIKKEKKTQIGELFSRVEGVSQKRKIETKKKSFVEMFYQWKKREDFNYKIWKEIKLSNIEECRNFNRNFFILEVSLRTVNSFVLLEGNIILNKTKFVFQNKCFVWIPLEKDEKGSFVVIEDPLHIKEDLFFCSNPFLLEKKD